MADQQLMTIQETRSFIKELTTLDRTVGTIRSWCERGYLRSRRIGGRIMVERQSVSEYLLGKEGADT